jgi:hypothetical protein
MPPAAIGARPGSQSRLNVNQNRYLRTDGRAHSDSSDRNEEQNDRRRNQAWRAWAARPPANGATVAEPIASIDVSRAQGRIRSERPRRHRRHAGDRSAARSCIVAVLSAMSDGFWRARGGFLSESNEVASGLHVNHCGADRRRAAARACWQRPTQSEEDTSMIKPITVALTLGLAAASAASWADDPAALSTSESSMQRCVTSERAKNDGTSDTIIHRTCTSKMSKHTEDTTNSPDSATVTDEKTTTTNRDTTTDSAPPK